jgi:photosystem II stability/assembly factor-like uncharacterized protein
MRFAISAALLFGPSIHFVQAAEWEVAATAELIKKEKPGFGNICGIVVDRASGDVFINLSDRGVFRSTDQGATWKLHGKPIKGRTETGGCMMFDPTGKTARLLLPTVYGGPIVVGSKEGDDWQLMNQKITHVDWCAVNWADAEFKFVLALKHESGGMLLVSRDGGKTFAEAGKGYGPAWVFDANTAVATLEKGKERRKASIVRTTDGGESFKPASEYSPVALPRWHGEALYWLVEGGLIKTADKGATWEKVCELKDARFGPVPGKDARHLFVLTGTGVIESTDAGVSWSKPIPLPAALKGINPLTWLDYDPRHDVVYLMKMGSDLFRMARTSKR